MTRTYQQECLRFILDTEHKDLRLLFKANITVIFNLVGLIFTK